MIETVILIPVAPKDVKRVEFAVRSIRLFAENYRIYLLLDGLTDSELAPILRASDVRIRQASEPSQRNWGKIWLLQCRTLIEASKADDLAPNAVFIRMDSDAIIIRKGFTQRAQRIFATRPKAGQIGQTFSNVRGARFPNAGWVNYLNKTMGWRGVLTFIKNARQQGNGLKVAIAAYLSFRRIIKQAIANGYVIGDICLGGFNVMRRDLIEAMQQRLDLDMSPFRYLPILGDDISMTLHTYLLGFSPMDDCSDDGLCGIEVAGFRVDPFILKARGHYALHPLKYGYRSSQTVLSEEELVDALLQT